MAGERYVATFSSMTIASYLGAFHSRAPTVVSHGWRGHRSRNSTCLCDKFCRSQVCFHKDASLCQLTRHSVENSTHSWNTGARGRSMPRSRRMKSTVMCCYVLGDNAKVERRVPFQPPTWYFVWSFTGSSRRSTRFLLLCSRSEVV